MDQIEARYEDGVLKPTSPIALRPGERVRLIVVRLADPNRWVLDRLSRLGAAEDIELSSLSLDEWATALEDEENGWGGARSGGPTCVVVRTRRGRYHAVARKAGLWIEQGHGMSQTIPQESDLAGVEYITDASGRRTAVIISLEHWGELLEDFLDVMTAASRSGESRIPWEEVEAALDRDDDLSR
jgi:predicted DNA-binding antitoxin AbrB/MazE fold protein